LKLLSPTDGGENVLSALTTGWNAFASATPTPTPTPTQSKPDLSAFDSLMPLSKPKPPMSTLRATPQPTPQPNYFSSSSSTNGMLLPQTSSSLLTPAPANVKSLSPSDINDLLS
jgi:hypothetical protein